MAELSVRKIKRRHKILAIIREGVRHGRITVYLEDGSRIAKAHYVWNKYFPNDPILSGEIIHHKDEIKINDEKNLEKKKGEFIKWLNYQS